MSFKFHLVKRTTISAPVQNGGLGTHDLVLFNKALLGKWLWRYAMERNDFWRKVVDRKYGVGLFSSKKGGMLSIVLLRWEMAIILNFGVILGARDFL